MFSTEKTGALLIVDGHSTTRRALERILCQKFEEVVSVESAEEAVELIVKNQSFSAVVTGMHFPYAKYSMSGNDVGRVAKKFCKNVVTVLFYTQDYMHNPEYDFFDHVVAKPHGLMRIPILICS